MEGIFVSDEFDGGRIDSLQVINDTIVGLVVPEDTLVTNPSPWYAFKIWSNETKSVLFRLTYPDSLVNRYEPFISQNGRDWSKANFYPSLEKQNRTIMGAEFELYDHITLMLETGPDTTWIAARPMATRQNVDDWMARLQQSGTEVTERVAGNSLEGRPIPVLTIGDTSLSKAIVLLSRQHPPELTGYQGLLPFVETITKDDPLATAFREEVVTYVFPLVNPDGVANGNWRHSSGGTDLNRDWANRNQQEVQVVHNFVEKMASQKKIYFMADFHSTWKDIFYPMHPSEKGNMPGLVPAIINQTYERLELGKPLVQPTCPDDTTTITSARYFFRKYGAESLTYEFGDSTDSLTINSKATTSATVMMEFMLDRLK